jgi:hypothetical protein
MGIPGKGGMPSLRSARSRGNGSGAIARASPQTIGAAPHLRPHLRRRRDDPALAVETGRKSESLHSAPIP